MKKKYKAIPKSEQNRALLQSRIDGAELRLRNSLGLLWRIHSLSYIMSRRPRYNPELNAGLSLIAWRTFITLANVPSMSGNEITALWGLEKMGVNRAVNELVNRGLAEREVDPDDKRRLPLKLTSEGHALYKELWRGASTDYAELASSLTAEELAAFNKASDILLLNARRITDGSFDA